MRSPQSPVSRHGSAGEKNLLRNMFGTAYDTNRYVWGSVDLYNEEGDYQSYGMDDEEEIRTVVAAIEKDVRAGNFDAYICTVWRATAATTMGSCSIIIMRTARRCGSITRIIRRSIQVCPRLSSLRRIQTPAMSISDGLCIHGGGAYGSWDHKRYMESV